MKLIALSAPAIAAVVAIPIAMNAAASRDFNAVVSAVEQRYSSHAERVPMMGFVSFCAWMATGGGVKGMGVVEFDHLPEAADIGELESVVRHSLGKGWQLFVADRNRNGDLSLIFVQPDGASMRMLVADFEHGELDLVRLEVNGDRLRHWMHDPEGSARHHDYGGSTPD